MYWFVEITFPEDERRYAVTTGIFEVEVLETLSFILTLKISGADDGVEVAGGEFTWT
jgi:hypothetical protein